MLRVNAKDAALGGGGRVGIIEARLAARDERGENGPLAVVSDERLAGIERHDLRDGDIRRAQKIIRPLFACIAISAAPSMRDASWSLR